MDTVEEYRGCGRYVATLPWVRGRRRIRNCMVANNGGALVSSVSSARHEGAPLAGRSMDGQWSTGGGGWRIVSTVSPAVFRLFTAVHGGAGAFCWGSSNRAPRLLLPRPSSSAFRFPGCGVIRRCYSWLTGCWNLSTAAALVVQSLGNAVPR